MLSKKKKPAKTSSTANLKKKLDAVFSQYQIKGYDT